MQRGLQAATNMHLMLGGLAAGAALMVKAGSRWRAPLALLAGTELLQGVGGRDTSPGLSATPGEQAAEAPERVHSKRIAGIQMRWEEHGDRHSGIPVVLVHGLPTSPRVWRYLIPYLTADNRPCLAWEQVGFGGSLAEGLGRDLSIGRQAEYLHAWLQDLGIKRALFVAHDYGGGVVQRLLVSHPELCRGLVLTDCVAYDNWPVLAVRLARAFRGLIKRLPPMLVKPFFMAALANLGHDNRARGLASAKLHWQPYQTALGPRAFAHQLAHFSARETRALAPELPRLDLNAPVQLVWADRDPLGMHSGEQLARDLAAPLQRIPGGRHFTPEDHPEVLAQAVRSVMESVDTEGG